MNYNTRKQHRKKRSITKKIGGNWFFSLFQRKFVIGKTYLVRFTNGEVETFLVKPMQTDTNDLVQLQNTTNENDIRVAFKKIVDNKHIRNASKIRSVAPSRRVSTTTPSRPISTTTPSRRVSTTTPSRPISTTTPSKAVSNPEEEKPEEEKPYDGMSSLDNCDICYESLGKSYGKCNKCNCKVCLPCKKRIKNKIGGNTVCPMCRNGLLKNEKNK